MKRLPTIMIVLTLLSGCATPTRGPYQPLTEHRRNPIEAQRLTLEAVEVMATDPTRAETLLRNALTADLYHGPAHNNLGVLCLQQGLLYDAANEFEWARKLMPGHPDPRMNLALTLETAGRINNALETYATALEVYPEHLPTMQALARCQLRHNRTDNQTPNLLRTIALRGETKQWRDWGQRQLIENRD